MSKPVTRLYQDWLSTTNRNKRSGWFTEFQDQARARCLPQFPLQKTEKYRFHHLENLNQALFQLPEQQNSTQFINFAFPFDTYTVNLIDGRLQQPINLSLPTGVSIEPLSQLSAVESNIFTLESLPETALGSANLANAPEALIIRIPSSLILDKPLLINIGHSEQALEQVASLSHPLIFIILESAAQADVIINFLETPAPILCNAQISVQVQADARLNYSQLNWTGSTTQQLWQNLKVTQQTQSQVSSFFYSQNAPALYTDAEYVLAGEGAKLEITALTLQNQPHQNTLYTKVRHLAPAGQSNQIYKSLQGPLTQCEFYGEVEVASTATGTSAEQNSRVMLLADSARALVRPHLKIYTDEVKCAHGVSCGQLDENEVFYLMSRGLPLALARLLIIQGFTDDALARIRFAPLAAYLQEKNHQQIKKVIETHEATKR